MKPTKLATLETLKRQGIEPPARLTDALHDARVAFLNEKLTGVERQAAVAALQALVDVAGLLRALYIHWRRTKNNYLAIEAQVLAVAAGFGPPSWSLTALQPGLAEHLKHPERELAKQLGLSPRGTGKTQPVEPYRARRALDPAMRDMHKLIAGCKVRPMLAARCVIAKYPKIDLRFETLAHYYARDWRPMYEQLGKLGRLDATARQGLFRTFPVEVRRELQKTAS